VIDVCNASTPKPVTESAASRLALMEKGISGNFNQKKYPVNPISHMKGHGIKSVFRMCCKYDFSGTFAA
jgi:hypothetical protein